MILNIRKKLAKLFYSDIFIFSENLRKKIYELENENRKSKELIDKNKSNLDYLYNHSSFKNYAFMVKGINNEKIVIREERKDFKTDTHYVSFERLSKSNKFEQVLKCEYRIDRRYVSPSQDTESVTLYLDFVFCIYGNESMGYGSLCMDYVFYIAKHESVSSIKGEIGSSHTSDKINRKRLLNFYKKFGFNITMENELQGKFYLDFDVKGVPLKISQT